MTAESDWNAWNIPTFFMNTAKTHNLIPQMPQITCLHYMFIDESGVENLVSDNKKKNLDSNWFTTGGVIVEAANVPKFEQVVDSIIKDCFIDRDIKLPSDFKLHYNSSRAKEHPMINCQMMCAGALQIGYLTRLIPLIADLYLPQFTNLAMRPNIISRSICGHIRCYFAWSVSNIFCRMLMMKES